MSKNPGPNKKNHEETNALFIKIAHEEFVKSGYASASTNAIVESSGMARGSLYYHFGDKKGLFSAVYLKILDEVGEIIMTEMEKASDPWDAFKIGCLTYIQSCKEDKYRCIMLQSQTALTLAERMAVQKKSLFALLEKAITEVMAMGKFEGQNIQITSILISGLIGEAGRALDLAEDKDEMAESICKDVSLILDKLAA